MLTTVLDKKIRGDNRTIGIMSNRDFLDHMLDYVDTLTDDERYSVYDHEQLLHHKVLDTEAKLRKVFPCNKVVHDRNDIGDLTYKSRDEYRFKKMPDYKGIEWVGDYTQDHASEFIKCIDPLYFIKEYCYLKHVTHGFIKFVPRMYQENQIRLMQMERNTIFAMSRQVGKTQTTASFTTHYAIFNPYKSIGIIAHKTGQARNLLKMIAMTIAALPDWIAPEIVLMSKDRIELSNGSIIQAFSSGEDSLRGFQFSMVLCDEGAFIEGFKETFALTIEPTLSSGDDTKCIIFSTPNGNKDINYFASLYHDAGDDYETSLNTFVRLRVNWNENPESLFAERERNKLKRFFKSDKRFDNGKHFKSDKLRKNGGSLSTFEREYETSFDVSEATLIDADVLVNIKTVDPTITMVSYKLDGMHYNEPISIYRNAAPTERITITVDLAQGIGGDNTAISVISYDTGQVIATYASNQISIQHFAYFLAQVCMYFNNALLVIELNRDGSMLSNIMEREICYPFLFKSDLRQTTHENKMRSGIETTQNKNRGCKNLKQAIESGLLTFQDKGIVDELKAFIEVSDGKYKAVNHTDDRVLSLVIYFTAMDNISFTQSMNNYIEDRHQNEDDEFFPYFGMDDGNNFHRPVAPIDNSYYGVY